MATILLAMLAILTKLGKIKINIAEARRSKHPMIVDYGLDKA
jgi:hypothetical protein